MTRSTFRCAYLLGEEEIEIRHLPTPMPGRGELIIEIEAATTCGTDVKVYRRGGHPRMLTPPCPFGHEIAGTVIDVGDGIARWHVGDRVVVANSASCGDCDPCRVGRENLCADLLYLNGAFAERLLVPERFVERSVYDLPNAVPPALGALAEPLACVVHGLDRMKLTDASDVLVIGGGPTGLMFGYVLTRAGHGVTLADPHPERLEVARRVGVSKTLRVTDREKLPRELSDRRMGSGGFDAAVDATGSPTAWRAAVEAVKPGGLVNFFGGCAPFTLLPLDAHRTHYHELTLIGSYHHRPGTFARALELLSEPRQPLAELVSFDCPLDDLETALEAMIVRRALKVAVRPQRD